MFAALRDGTMGDPAEVTMLIARAAGGDAKASEDLLPLLYDELRALARGHMSRERNEGTLQPTALVHEAYMRLLGGDGADIKWENRAHFFGAAALAMRRILVERARSRNRIKRGGGLQRAELREDAIGAEPEAEEVLALDAVLDKLREMDPRKHEVVMLRYFAGLSIEETARAMNLSAATIKNEWTFAKAWLRRAIAEADPE
jgi:RNA polymerase sigma factor (TIGR02999 family)